MITTTTKRPTIGTHRITLRRVAAICALSLGAFALSSGTVTAAADGCGEYSYGFTGTRLINDGISTSAGPYAISLPAGTYDVQMWSNDNHPSPDYQTDQTAEQWYFVLDNGYSSPPTLDIPNNAESTVTSIEKVTLDAATTITVHHRLVGSSPNSVNVECVGFTPANVDISPPATPAITEPSVLPPVVHPPSVSAPVATVPTEVKPVVEAPPIPQLAVTGTDSSLVYVGLLLLLTGVALVVSERRVEQRHDSRTEA